MGQSEVFLFGGNVHIKPEEKERVETADLQILSWGGCGHILLVFVLTLIFYYCMHDVSFLLISSLPSIVTNIQCEQGGM